MSPKRAQSFAAKGPPIANDQTMIVGAILAGGQARRMGGVHKALQNVGGEIVLSRLIARLRPQVGALVLNVNADPALFAGFGLPIVADDLPGHPGPLAGILAALDWAARAVPSARWVVSIPGDAPFIPVDLVSRLYDGMRRQDTNLACAESAGRTHPVIGLWPVALRFDLRHALVEESIRRIDRFTRRYAVATISWLAEPVDPFFNVNTPDDLARANVLATRTASG